MVESARKVRGSVPVGGGNPKSLLWNNQVKAVFKRKEVLGTIDGDARESGLEVYIKEKRKVKRCIYQSKKEVQEQLERKINQGVNGNGKLFWKEVSYANGGNVENFSRIKDEMGI